MVDTEIHISCKPLYRGTYVVVSLVRRFFGGYVDTEGHLQIQQYR